MITDEGLMIKEERERGLQNFKIYISLSF